MFVEDLPWANCTPLKIYPFNKPPLKIAILSQYCSRINKNFEAKIFLLQEKVCDVSKPGLTHSNKCVLIC